MKMMKEEEALIKKLAESYQNGQSIMVEKYVAKDIRALIHAVREDEREKCAEAAWKELVSRGVPQPIRTGVAAAIRERR